MTTGRTSRRNILIVAVVAVVMAAGGFLAARLVVSPEDAASRAAPPPAEPITVAVERKRLDASIVTRGEIAFTGSTEVVLTDGTATNLVITGRIPEVGAVVQPGAVLIEVTGRPVIAFSGELPTYRNLAPGSSGPDVEQLEAALAALGYDPGPQDKLYDAATGAAVAAHYRTLGYEPPAPSAEVTTAAKAAQDAVDLTARAVVTAQRNLDRAGAGPSRSQRLTLQGAVDGAQAGYDRARQTPTEPDPGAVGRATDALAAAQDAHTQALIALQQAMMAGVPDVTAEQDANARAERAVGDAQAALDDATQPGPPSQAAIDAAKNQVDVAVAQRDEALAVDTSAEQAALSEAKLAASGAQAALVTAQAAAGTPLPAQEVVWLRDMPRRVDEVLVTRGAVVKGALMKVSGADLLVQARVTADEVGLLKVGMPARLTVRGSPEITATISKIGGVTPSTASDSTGTQSTDNQSTDGGQRPTGTAVMLQPSQGSAEQAQALRGSNAKVTIAVGSTSGEVLVVPVAALFSDADGTTRVEIDEPGGTPGTTRFQRVAVGLTTGGQVEVSPIDDIGRSAAPGPTTLQDGSLVVVGR